MLWSSNATNGVDVVLYWARTHVLDVPVATGVHQERQVAQEWNSPSTENPLKGAPIEVVLFLKEETVEYVTERMGTPPEKVIRRKVKRSLKRVSSRFVSLAESAVQKISFSQKTIKEAGEYVLEIGNFGFRSFHAIHADNDDPTKDTENGSRITTSVCRPCFNAFRCVERPSRCGLVGDFEGCEALWDHYFARVS